MGKYLKIIAIILMMFTVLVFASVAFGVKKIEVSDNACITKDDVGQIGKLIFSISEQKLKKDLESRFPCLSELKLQKVYPATIKLEITSGGAVAKVADTKYVVTIDGKLQEGQDGQLPVLYLSSEASQNGKITDQKSLFALMLASLLAKTDFRPTAIRVLEAEIVAYDPHQVTAHFSPLKDANIQVDSLQQTVAAAKIEGDKIAKIDLRFDKPVITFK